MITLERAVIAKIAMRISAARDQTMAKPVPPPVIGFWPIISLPCS
jgi:hypothetical protein